VIVQGSSVGDLRPVVGGEATGGVARGRARLERLIARVARQVLELGLVAFGVGSGERGRVVCRVEVHYVGFGASALQYVRIGATDRQRSWLGHLSYVYLGTRVYLRRRNRGVCRESECARADGFVKESNCLKII
jgi:hypothetical protein